MELSEIIAKLLEKFGTDGKAVVDALHRSALPLYQQIHDTGHGAGLAKGRQEKADSDAKVATLQAELTAAQAKLTELQASQPDAQKIHDQYKAEIQTLKDAHKKAVDEERTKRATALRDRHVADLRTALTRKLDPLVARLLAQDPEVQKRLVLKDDGTLDVLQDGKDIPFSPAEGQSALELLADELVSKQDPKFRLADADAGSGTESGNRGTQGGGDIFDRIRAGKKAEIEQSKSTIKSLDEKLGMVASS